LTAEKSMVLIRVYVSEDIKKQVAEVSDKVGLSESAWVRMQIIHELQEIKKEENQ